MRLRTEAGRIRSGHNDAAVMRGPIVGLGGRMPEKVTAVITCMTDAERPFIRAALESVVNQTMPCAARVYVADTNDWIANVTEGLEQVVVRPLPMMPVAAIRNHGVKEANSALEPDQKVVESDESVVILCRGTLFEEEEVARCGPKSSVPVTPRVAGVIRAI